MNHKDLGLQETKRAATAPRCKATRNKQKPLKPVDKKWLDNWHKKHSTNNLKQLLNPQ